jgi:hypothetical protein
VQHIERVARCTQEYETPLRHRRIDLIARRFRQAVEQAGKTKPSEAFPKIKARDDNNPCRGDQRDGPSPALRCGRRAAERIERNAEQEGRQNPQRADLRRHLRKVAADARQHGVQIVERRERGEAKC